MSFHVGTEVVDSIFTNVFWLAFNSFYCTIFKERPIKDLKNLKNLQLLRGFAPQTPQQGVALATHQGATGPWTPNYFPDFENFKVSPMVLSVINLFIIFDEKFPVIVLRNVYHL